MRYSDTVMDHFMNPRNIGQLDDADGVGIIGSPECGDQIRVWIKVKDGKLSRVHHQVFGCPAAIAACSMMTELATGLTIQQGLALTDDAVAAALGGLPPAKYHCSNLAASALHDAIENFQFGQTAAANTVKITTLINNLMPAPLLAEHGLSFWIEYGGKHILFDTGQTDALIKNADLLDIDLSTTNAIVLSHGHCDHTGGLEAALKLAPNAIVYLHSAAPTIRYSCHPSKPPKDISMPQAVCQKIAESAAKGNVIYTDKPTTVYPGITVSGQIPRQNDYEDTGGPFYLERQARTEDRLDDDQTLLISTAKGLLVLLGCAHAGLINTLEYVTTLTCKPIYAVAGGMHLQSASEQRLQKTLQAMKNRNIPLIAPCHCTGQVATQTLREQFPKSFHDILNAIRIEI